MHFLFIFTTSTLVGLVGVLAAPLPLPGDFPDPYSVQQFGKPAPQRSPSYYKVQTIGGMKAASTDQNSARGSSYKPYKVTTMGGIKAASTSQMASATTRTRAEPSKAAPTDQMAPATTRTQKSRQDDYVPLLRKMKLGPLSPPGSAVSIGGHKITLVGGRPKPGRYDSHLMGEIKDFFSRNRRNKLGERIQAMTQEEWNKFEEACQPKSRPKAPVRSTPPPSSQSPSAETTNGKGPVEHAASPSSSVPAVVSAKLSPESVNGVKHAASSPSAPAVVPANQLPTSPETKEPVEHTAPSSVPVVDKQSATPPETVSGVEQTAPSKDPHTSSPQSPAAAKTWSGAAGNMLSGAASGAAGAASGAAGAASSAANAAYGVASSAYNYWWGSKVKKE